MIAQLIFWIQTAWQVISLSNSLILWNSFLAFIPLVLSVWLFRWAHSRSLVWWIVFIIFLAFLPNAPYVLTDIIHLIDWIREGFPTWIVTLVLIPQYFLFILAGFEAYVMALINLGYYLERQGLGQYIVGIELVTHLLCAIGIYLGRFQRFNSWDFVAQPNALAQIMVEDFTSRFPLLVVIITFGILVILYWLMKQVNLGIVTRFNTSKKRVRSRKD
jgi:uncharacterized membrane protein